MDVALKERIKDFINNTIKNIPSKGIFDSHLIIQQMLKKESDLFYKFIIDTGSSETEYVHSQLARIIKTVPGVRKHFLNNEIKSWSENIHGNVSACTAWVKR